MKDEGLSLIPSAILRTSRKRSRCCTSLLVYSVAAVALVRPVNSFLAVSKSPTSLTSLQAFRSLVTDRVEPLVPKPSSNKQRREVVTATKRSKVETALDGVDAQMLELLSEQFLYPDSDSKAFDMVTKNTRPKGRPELVPGAMKFETMIRFQEQKGAVSGAHDRYSESMPDRRSENLSNDHTPMQARKDVKPRGSASFSASDALPEEGEGNHRRKVDIKNLPRREESSEKIPAPKKVLKGRAKANNLELQKYYRTELLNAQEEYSLGMRIQLMVKCEEVHEGLATELMRLPTIKEWAEACGYVLVTPYGSS